MRGAGGEANTGCHPAGGPAIFDCDGLGLVFDWLVFDCSGLGLGAGAAGGSGGGAPPPP